MRLSSRAIEIVAAIVIAAIVVLVTAGPAASSLVALAALVVCGLSVLWDRRSVRKRARRIARGPRGDSRGPRGGNGAGYPGADRRSASSGGRTMKR